MNAVLEIGQLRASGIRLLVGWGLVIGLFSELPLGWAQGPAGVVQSEVVRPSRILENSIGMRFIEVLPGEFLMGSPPSEANRFAHERQHLVRITKTFWMGMEEVSEAQFERGIGNRSPRSADEETPAASINWFEAEDFCRKLSEQEGELSAGRSYRLPTEAEWEYTCRAGTRTAYSWGDSPDSGAEYAWSVENSEGIVRRIGSRKPNPWGFYDFHGHVWEWCSDWYGDLPTGPTTDPQGPATGEYRVVRGGADNSPASYLRSAMRVPLEPIESQTSGAFGFRVVLMIDPGVVQPHGKQ